MNQCDGCRRGLPTFPFTNSKGRFHAGEGYDYMACTADRYVTTAAPCGSDIPSILELQLRKSVELTKKDVEAQVLGIGTGRSPNALPVEDPDQDEYADALKRVKKLLAETREMVVRAEALVASLRAPKDCYQPDRS